MAKKKTRQYYAYSINKGWKANFSFEEVILRKKKESPSKRKKGPIIITEDFLAADILRRRRASVKNPKTSQNWFRTIAGLINPKTIEIELPKEERTLLLKFSSSASPINTILDFPEKNVSPSTASRWGFIPTAIEIELLCDKKGNWPSYISSATIKNSRSKRQQQITLRTLLKTYFGLNQPTQGHGIILNPDGLTLKGVKSVPWENDQGLPGKFRYRVQNANDHLLEIEKDKAWINSLRNFQHRVIEATAHVEDDNGLPEINSPAVGLVSSKIPDKVFWQLQNNQWEFKPDKGMFEGEIRGAAGGTSRLQFDKVLITNSGKNIKCIAGDATLKNSQLKYEYQQEEKSLWSGDFEAELENDSAELMASLMDQYGMDEDSDKVWIQTESGALQIPLCTIPENENTNNSIKTNAIFKGLVRLSEVPWVQETSDLPPSPDISQARYSSMIIIDTNRFEVEIKLDNSEACQSVVASLGDPELRLEDYVPIYLPAITGKSIFKNGPPDLPEPSGLDESSSWNHFLGLSLIRKKGFEPKDGATHFKVKLAYIPGVADKKKPIEGDWSDSHTEILTPPEKVDEIEYWYRPPGLHWFPSLPLYGDPRKGDRLNEKRTYLPLKASESPMIMLRPGINWQVPVLMFGQFKAESFLQNKSQYSVFNWVIPELPGIAFELKNDASITIAEGLPSAGKLNWVWRHDLPILDEIEALRSSGEEEKKKKTETINNQEQNWIQQLIDSYTLSQSNHSLLLRSTVNLKQGLVLSEKGKKVQIENLFANQKFNAQADLKISPPSASLDFSNEAEIIEAIKAKELLKGISASFEVRYDNTHKKFNITPVSKSGEVIINAGSMQPFHSSVDDKSVVVDQGGTGAFKISDSKKGRMVLVTDGNHVHQKSWLWSHDVLDLSTPVNNVLFSFSNIPLILENDAWKYNNQNSIFRSPQLRNFRWSSLGEIDFWGLPFQVCNLVELQFKENENIPSIPVRVVFEGILHLKPGSISLADYSSQGIQISFIRNGNEWELEAFEGHILWPFYEAAPDLSITANLPDPLPWLSSPVSIQKIGDKTALIFEGVGEQASVVFHFMERQWKLPVGYVDKKILKPLSANHTFGFELINSNQFIQSTLVPISGIFYLKRKGANKNSKLEFKLIETHEGNSGRPLLDITFKYIFNKEKKHLTVKKANFLSFGESNHLISLTESEKGEVELSPGKLSMAINKAVNWRSTKPVFEFLPGWNITDKESLQAYVSLELNDPPAAGEVDKAELKKLIMVIETAIETPNIVATQFSYSLSSGADPELEVKLTGMLSLQNEISWITTQRGAFEHKIEVLMRDASIKGSELDSNGKAFFRPKYIPSSGKLPNTTGMIEIPTLVNHQINRIENGISSEYLRWTASQHIRLANPRSIIEEVLLRGSKSISLPYFQANEARTLHNFSKDDELINFEASEKVEMGFVGALGYELKKLLNSTPDVMIVEATEAFWLRPFTENITERAPFNLWKKRDTMVSGIPSFELDFDDSGKSETAPWTRLAMPFITDTSGHINTNKSQLLHRYLTNQFKIKQNDEGTYVAESTFINREQLLKLNSIDQYALDHQPNLAERGNGMDQVNYDPVANTRLFPYTTIQDGFQPGWLSFYDWRLSDPSDNTKGIPFGSTLGAITGLIKHAGKTHMAVTEAVPKIEEISYERRSAMNCYYITSPAIHLEQRDIPFELSKNSVRQLAATPRIFLDWKGVTKEELIYIPSEVTHEVLEWANNLSAYELKNKVPDAPGGFSLTEEGYGIGELVISRIKSRIQQQGQFSALNQLLAIKGFGIDKMSDFIYAVAKTRYDFSFENQNFEEIRIHLQFWSANSNSSATFNLGLAIESVFLLGITEEDSWQSVLFPPEDPESYSKVRQRIWEWVATETSRLNIATSPLLRVQLLTPSSFLEQRKYFLITSRPSGGVLRQTKRKQLNTTVPLVVDLRFEKMGDTVFKDPLASGPELLDGKVYYESRAMYEPADPKLDNQQWKRIISSFKVEPKTINKGEVTTLNWVCDEEGIYQLSEREADLITELEGKSTVLKPEKTVVYVLTLKDKSGQIIDRVETFVKVRVPAAGNAIGFTHKIAGTAPGPLNTERTSPQSNDVGYHRWLEMTRDVIFHDVTKTVGLSQSPLDQGDLLPASRKIAFEAKGLDRSNMNPFLAPRVGHIFTAGRPGTMMNFRLAGLIESNDAMVRRGGSWGNEFRFPRPVPLPRELYPFDADYTGGLSDELPTCSVASLDGPEPFTFYQLAWQDPIFNRRLLAVAQEQVQGAVFLGMDRPVYAGKDVCYPEVRIMEKDLGNWKLVLDVMIERTVNFQSETVDIKTFEIIPGHVINTAYPSRNIEEVTKLGDETRYVFEIGIAQKEAVDDNFLNDPENEDLLIVRARLYLNGDERVNTELRGLIRTDKDSWSQPQNAYGVERKTHLGDTMQSDIVAFGWAPKPKIVKRRDRFRPDSWEGTFRYKDAFVKPPGATIDYEVFSITSYGEMKVKE
ncbi:MAG: hypothetical protein ABJF11_11695 [Reichenbachiella sp.]|uniref:hypothetical protein n=1 Tax=Reichenbachiella sp. TaxID=2184521 RepID=UPI00326427CA